LDEEFYTETQIDSLMVILSENKTNMCLMTHRPLKKVTRSPWVLLTGVLVFTLICFVFYYGMRGRRDFLPTLHDKLYLTSYILVGLIAPTYLLAVSLNPGRLARRFDFLYLVDTLLEKGLHLDNVCVYDEILKSETSFHCQICNRCVELFDHHCPFINNCLGSNNHKYFLIFLASYVCFLLVLTIEVTRHMTDVLLNDTTPKALDYLWPLALVVLIVLNAPVVGF
jgi:hypothetical protein